MNMPMKRLLLIAAALTFAVPALAADKVPAKKAPTGQKTPVANAPVAKAPAKKQRAASKVFYSTPAPKKMRRVNKLERIKLTRMKIKGRPGKPLIEAIVEKSRLHFESGTIQYRHGRKSFERFY